MRFMVQMDRTLLPKRGGIDVWLHGLSGRVRLVYD